MTLDPLYRVIGYLLAVFYVPFHSLGLADIALTIVIMAVQFPLIAKQSRSMIQMQRVQPEVKKIQAKYKDDKAKQNEELLKFYQENKINPLSGCLPMIITIPIGIAVFRTFERGVQHHLPQSGRLGELYHAMCHNATTTKACGKAIGQHTPQAMRFLGMSLNLAARQATGFPDVLPYYVLVALVVATGWYQVKQTQAKQLQSGNAQATPQMQAMTKIFPVVFGLISLGINSAATIYFVVSNVWRIGQQHFVLGKMYDEAVETGTVKPPKELQTKEPPATDTGGNGAGTKSAPKAGGSGPAKPDPKSAASNGDAGRQGMSSGARRKKKRKR